VRQWLTPGGTYVIRHSAHPHASLPLPARNLYIIQENITTRERSTIIEIFAKNSQTILNENCDDLILTILDEVLPVELAGRAGNVSGPV
jgi:hypothetical protein